MKVYKTYMLQDITLKICVYLLLNLRNDMYSITFIYINPWLPSLAVGNVVMHADWQLLVRVWFFSEESQMGFYNWKSQITLFTLLFGLAFRLGLQRNFGLSPHFSRKLCSKAFTLDGIAFIATNV